MHFVMCSVLVSEKLSIGASWQKSNSPQYLFLAGKNRSVEVDAGVDKQAGRHLAFVFPAGHEEEVEVLPEPDHLSRVGRLEAGGSL